MGYYHPTKELKYCTNSVCEVAKQVILDLELMADKELSLVGLEEEKVVTPKAKVKNGDKGP